MIQVKFRKFLSDAVIPKYQTGGASGFDLHSALYYLIPPGQIQIVQTGLEVEIPEGYELQIRPRSGLSAKTKLRIANSPGTVDSDYRGQLGIIVENTLYVDPTVSDPYNPNYAITINPGDRIAQGVIVPVIRAEIVEVDKLSSTDRGAGGYGSTGK